MKWFNTGYIEHNFEYNSKSWCFNIRKARPIYVDTCNDFVCMYHTWMLAQYRTINAISFIANTCTYINIHGTTSRNMQLKVSHIWEMLCFHANFIKKMAQNFEIVVTMELIMLNILPWCSKWLGISGWQTVSSDICIRTQSTAQSIRCVEIQSWGENE